MQTLQEHTRLKVNQDTRFTPDTKGGIYFRNNTHTFRMHGSTVYEWMEKLIPILDGNKTMKEITDGLPDPFQKRIYEFANILLQNGFVRDTSTDKAHTLSEKITTKYQSQINYLDHLLGSGAHRFEQYRKSKLLVIGSGQLLLSLLSSLLQSGLEKIHMYVTEKQTTSYENIYQLVQKAQKENTDIIDISSDEVIAWSEILQPFDAILYVGKESNKEEVLRLGQLCNELQKCFLPAITFQSIGMVGPDNDWESAWNRFSTHINPLEIKYETETSLALLANQLAFIWFQITTQIKPDNKPHVFLLDFLTLDGGWHSFHPLANVSTTPLLQENWDTETNRNLNHLFSSLTSANMGIFHSLGPENLLQLPLSQCQVTIADPLSNSRSKKLTTIVCGGSSHQEALKEAGLSGVEAYGSHLFHSLHSPSSPIEIGAGKNDAEAIYRGLQKSVLRVRDLENTPPSLPYFHLALENVKDKQAHFYAKCMQHVVGTISISISETMFGFPTISVRVGDAWITGTGFHHTSALRNCLQKALQVIQNHPEFLSTEKHNSSSSFSFYTDTFLPLPENDHNYNLSSALQILKKHNKTIHVFRINLENVINQHLSVVGVMVREESI